MWNTGGTTETGKPKKSKTLAPVPICPQQTPHGLSWPQPRSSTVIGQRPTVLAMAWPNNTTFLYHKLGTRWYKFWKLRTFLFLYSMVQTFTITETNNSFRQSSHSKRAFIVLYYIATKHAQKCALSEPHDCKVLGPNRQLCPTHTAHVAPGLQCINTGKVAPLLN
jgi:hypothetical protein